MGFKEFGCIFDGSVVIGEGYDEGAEGALADVVEVACGDVDVGAVVADEVGDDGFFGGIASEVESKYDIG